MLCVKEELEMAKESLQSAENLEAVDVLSEKKSRRSWELLIMIKMLLMKLQKSPDYRQNTFRKMQNYLRKRDVCICTCRT